MPGGIIPVPYKTQPVTSFDGAANKMMHQLMSAYLGEPLSVAQPVDG